jgi:hypothetical protein
MANSPIDPQAWRRIAESKIEQAIRDGQFDNLEGFGKPFPPDFDVYDENWWLKRKAKLEGLSLLPPALELQRVVEKELCRISSFDSEADVRRAIDVLNAKIAHANKRIGWGPPSRVFPIIVDEFVNSWRETLGGEYAPRRRVEGEERAVGEESR